MGFNVRVECERLVKNYEEQGILWLARDWLASWQLVKSHVRSTCWKLKSQVSGGISRLGQFVRWPARCTTSLLSVFSSFLYPHYKNPLCPRNCKENLREKNQETHLRVRDCKPTIIYTFLLDFLYSYLSNYISYKGS